MHRVPSQIQLRKASARKVNTSNDTLTAISGQPTDRDEKVPFTMIPTELRWMATALFNSRGLIEKGPQESGVFGNSVSAIHRNPTRGLYLL